MSTFDTLMVGGTVIMLLCIIAAQKCQLRTAAAMLEQATEKLKEAKKLLADVGILNGYYSDKLADKEKQLAAAKKHLDLLRADLAASNHYYKSIGSRARDVSHILYDHEPAEERTDGPDSPTT